MIRQLQQNGSTSPVYLKRDFGKRARPGDPHVLLDNGAFVCSDCGDELVLVHRAYECQHGHGKTMVHMVEGALRVEDVCSR